MTLSYVILFYCVNVCTSSKVLTVAVQLQEFRTGATRQAMETTKSKEDCKDLRQDVTDLRDKINDLDNRVRLPLTSLATRLTASFPRQPG